jgi:hypothetical protein
MWSYRNRYILLRSAFNRRIAKNNFLGSVMQIKRGNKADLQFIVKDANGVVLTNLSSATNIQFVLKKNKIDLDEDAVVLKNLTDGITIDTPLIGNCTVTLTSLDMNIPAQNYFWALKITFSSTSIQEVNIKNPNVRDILYIDYISVVENISHV